MFVNPVARHDPAERVAAGVVYLVLSIVLFVGWAWTDVAMLLLLALPTAVAGLVSLSVGWPRLRRELAAEQTHRSHGSPGSTSPPGPTGR